MKIFSLRQKAVATFIVASLCIGNLWAETDSKQRTIVFNEDRGQHFMTTKVYELKNVLAHDLLPYVEGAVKRFDEQSTVQSLDYKVGGKQFLVVSASPVMLQYVDEMIPMLDYPSQKVDVNGSVVEGDGISTHTYYGKYRASEDMKNMVNLVFEPEGYGGGTGYYAAGANMIYWKGSASQSAEYLKLLEALDRPVPQLQVELNMYVVTDNYFRELGIDYVGWKNGPGMDLLSTGFDFTQFFSDQTVSNFVNLVSDGPAWDATGLSSILIAPNFDATFLRLLAQKGKANIASTAAITLTNDFSITETYDDAKYRFKFTPQFQTIVKDSDTQETTVISTDSDSELSEVTFFLSQPIICFGEETGIEDPAKILMTTWSLEINSMVESDNLGNLTTDSHSFSSWVTAEVGTEKLLAVYDKFVDVKQYNGMPFFGEIPVLKYLVGAESIVKSKNKVFVTMSIKPVITKNNYKEVSVLTK